MKRYIALAIFLIASLAMYFSEPFVESLMQAIVKLPEWVLVIAVVFFLTAPTFAVIIFVYDATVKLTGRWLRTSLRASRLMACLAVIVCVFGIPFVFAQILEKEVQAAIADDRPVTAPTPLDRKLTVRHESTGRDAAHCDWDCQDLLQKGTIDSFTAAHALDDQEMTFAYRTGGTCLGWDAFVIRRDSPNDFNAKRVNGRCIIEIPAPDAVDYLALETRFPQDSNLRGTRMTITQTATNDIIYQRSAFWPQRPFFILGLVKDRLDQGGSPVGFGLTRFPAEHREGTDQTLLAALRLLAGS